MVISTKHRWISVSSDVLQSLVMALVFSRLDYDYGSATVAHGQASTEPSGGCCICLEQSAGDSTLIAAIASFPQ